MLRNILVGALGEIAFLVAELVKARSPGNSEQLRVVVFGVVAGIPPLVLLTVLSQAMGLSRHVRPEITELGIVVDPVSCGSVIQRWQLMNIRRLVHRGAAYAPILLTILMIYGLIFGYASAGGNGSKRKPKWPDG